MARSVVVVAVVAAVERLIAVAVVVVATGSPSEVPLEAPGWAHVAVVVAMAVDPDRLLPVATVVGRERKSTVPADAGRSCGTMLAISVSHW